MRNTIHPSAIVAKDVELGENNLIGPYSIIGGMGCRVSIGSHNYIGAYTLIGSPAEFATGCPINAMLNFEQWSAANPSKVSGVKIGNYNVIRDRVSIDNGIYQNTTIDDYIYLHSNCLVNHDCLLDEGVVLAPNVILAGNCVIEKYSQIGANAVLHQGLKVGAFTMIGMNATVTRNIPDFALSYGTPSRIKGANRIRLARMGITLEDIERTSDFLLGITSKCPQLVLNLLQCQRNKNTNQQLL